MQDRTAGQFDVAEFFRPFFGENKGMDSGTKRPYTSPDDARPRIIGPQLE